MTVDEHVARAPTCIEQKQTVPLLLLSEPTPRASIVISLQFWPKEFNVKKLALVSLAFALLMSLTALAQNAPKKDPEARQYQVREPYRDLDRLLAERRRGG